MSMKRTFSSFLQTLFPSILSFSHRANLRVNQFFGYFGVAMRKWLSVARNKLIHRIEYVLERDKMDAVVSTPVSNKWTASSVDIASCFTQMVQFWRRLGKQTVYSSSGEKPDNHFRYFSLAGYSQFHRIFN